jgi:hypothetical protein
LVLFGKRTNPLTDEVSRRAMLVGFFPKLMNGRRNYKLIYKTRNKYVSRLLVIIVALEQTQSELVEEELFFCDRNQLEKGVESEERHRLRW